MRPYLIPTAVSLLWILIAVLIVRSFGISGGYLAFWSALLAAAGLAIIWFTWHAVSREKPMVIWIAGFLFVLIAIAALAYLFWPFRYTLSVVNTKGNPVIAAIEIADDKGETVYSGQTTFVNITLWKGSYTVHATSTGYQDFAGGFEKKVAFEKHAPLVSTARLVPLTVLLSAFTATDPTTTITLRPRIRALGMAIEGDVIDSMTALDGTLTYGDYTLIVNDDHFEAIASLHGTALVQDGKATTSIRTAPNKEHLLLKESDVKHILTFLTDYITLANAGKIKDPYPKEFYLRSLDREISLGKMLYLFCEEEAYRGKEIEKVYFIPREARFSRGEEETDNCLIQAIEGHIPKTVDGEAMGSYLYSTLTTNATKYPEVPDALDHEERGINVAFTFDMESGRYINTKDGLSPCLDANTSLGLTPDELVCDNPALVAWMTPRDETAVTYTSYSYPQVSGILGTELILSIPERYGIPITTFWVKKDALAFQALDPQIIERTTRLAKEGLIEIGSHTRYHTELSMVEKNVSREEMIASLAFLESFFGVPVIGFRGPYLSRIDGEGFYQALDDAGYAYYSNGEDGYKGAIPNFHVIDKPYNAGTVGYSYSAYQDPQAFVAAMKDHDYLITLDHPWNIVYQDGTTLVEDPAIKDNWRSVILTAIANGAIAIPAKDLNLT